MRSPFSRFMLALLTYACVFSVSTSLDIFSNPTGGEVVAGNAAISSPSSRVVQIHQMSNKAIINWQSFNIGAKEKTQFIQPSSHAIVLNRINPGQGVSQIYGLLKANGQIILINQAGIYFGPGSHVDVAGIIASTSNISNENFLAGNYIFDQASPFSGSVINEGTIIARNNGLVALLGTGAVNNGLIQAKLGNVVLASGNKFTIFFNGDQFIGFSVDEAATTAGVDQNGNRLKNGVSNTGKIIANGGMILISARAASNVLDNAINMQGVAIAHSVSQHAGAIILSGGENGTVRVSGHLNVSSRNNQGGTIKISGNNINVGSNAILNASGKTGGGEILVGGNAHGAGPGQNASYTYIAKGASILANALLTGNGGQVVVWSDLGTGFYGNIDAKGGALSGNGGFVETSGKAYLDAMGTVNASAPAGLSGNWLLDPFNVTITTTTTNGAFDNGSPTDTYAPTANTATANVATINSALSGGTNVTVNTGSSGVQAGTITLSSAILKNAGSTATLTLNAAGGITLDNTITSTSGGLNVTLIGDALTINSAITTNGGNFLSTTQNATTLASTLNTGAGTVTMNVNQDSAGANAFVMSAGSSITTTNSGASAVAINVNTAAGGTGTAALRDITTGSGGTISVATNTGGNATGGSITMPSGTLNAGTGTISLFTSAAAARAIGTAALNIQMIAGNITTGAGSGGTFITNTGASALNLLANTGTGGGFTLSSLNSSAITNSGTLTFPGTLTIAAGATQDITLNSAANNFGTVVITSGRNVSLLDTNSTILGASTISGTLGVTAGGTISQSGALTVSGTPTFTVTAPLSDILLSTSANAFSTTPVFTSNGNIRDLSLRRTLAGATVPAIPTGVRNLTLIFDSAGMVLPTMTLTGTLSATANGTITQTGPLAITGITTLAAGSANDITLNNANNDFSTATIISGNNVSLRDLNAFILGASTIGGTLNVTTNGALTQSGAGLTVTGATTLAAGSANNITLNTAGNNFSSVGITSGNNVLLRDANSLILNASTVTGTLGVTTAGAITQAGALNITGITTLAAGSTNDITLNNASNIFSRIGITSGNNVALVDTNALILGTSNVSGTYTVTAGGTLSEAGVLTVAGTPTFTLTTPGTDILLSTQANAFTVTPVFTNNGNIRDLALRRTLALAGIPVLPAGLRNLTLTYNSAINLPAITLTGSFTGSAAGGLTLGGNLTTGANSSVTVTAGTFAIADGATFNSNNTNLNITATDFNLNTTGALNLGTGTLNIISNTANSTIGLGNTAGTMTISGSELQRMTATIFNLSAPSDSQLILDGITAANSAGIGTMNFLANTGQISSMVILNNPSSFKALTASIDNGITVGSGASLTTTVGNMVLNGDAGGIGGSNNSILLNGNLTSAGTMTLSAFLNGIIINAPVTLTANGITINHAVNGANDLIINAGTGTTTFVQPVGATTPLLSLVDTNATDTVISQNINTTGNISIASGGNLTLSTGNLTSSAGSVLLTGTGITLNSTIHANAAGNSIVIAGQTFTNNTGSGVFSPGAGNFLVWSGNPANDNRGGLAYNFKQYNAIYGSTAVAGTGNGFLYTLAPVITPSLMGSVSKEYNGTTNATLTGSNYTFSGAIDSDTVTLNNPVNGTYGSPNVGTNINVSVAGIAIVSATNGSATVYGYQITPVANANIGQITQAPLTITANNASKTYGQTTTFTGTEFTAAGLQNGQTVGSTTLASAGAINTANVSGSPYSIDSSLATGGTFNPTNYSITYANGTLTVNPAALTITANNASKTYGQTTTFTGTEFTAAGLQNGETVGSTTLASVGAINIANVSGSPYSIDSSLATGGTFDANNYAITYTNGALTVTPATLVYTANTAARLFGEANPAFSGNIAGFVLGETQASATTGTMVFDTTATPVSTAGYYPITGSGLSANFGNYVFTQAASNATALTINPVTPVPPPPVPSPSVPSSVVPSLAVPLSVVPDKSSIVNVMISSMNGHMINLPNNNGSTILIINNTNNTGTINHVTMSHIEKLKSISATYPGDQPGIDSNKFNLEEFAHRFFVKKVFSEIAMTKVVLVSSFQDNPSIEQMSLLTILLQGSLMNNIDFVILILMLFIMTSILHLIVISRMKRSEITAS
ncbi:MAG TPA: MBG domain-containing protein [Gammaproteobacteria bacterium]|nr:MBG domain-containing protein [Gammaproteobacteria bacterium]